MFDDISTILINFMGILLEIFGSIFLSVEFLTNQRYTILVQKTNVEKTPSSEYILGKDEVEKYFEEKHKKRKIKYGLCGSILIGLGLVFQLVGLFN
ncbi:MAG: hypothetical protein KAT05_06110 [Spirochaetes bacterium]|nr:hypothetical protein [Spirochaetota bacterium]